MLKLYKIQLASLVGESVVWKELTRGLWLSIIQGSWLNSLIFGLIPVIPC